MSAEHDDIASPPYPRITATSVTLYRVLHALRVWVIDQVNQLKKEVPPQKAAELSYPGSLPNESVWEVVSVMDKYTAMMFSRRIRETWDAILREHELDWGSKLCLKKRFYLVLSALEVLEEAFVDPDTREERYINGFREHHNKMRAIRQHLKDVVLPPELRDEVEEDNHPEDLDDGW